MVSFKNSLKTNEGLDELNAILAISSYVNGTSPSKGDATAFNHVTNNIHPEQHPHVARWVKHIAYFSAYVTSNWGGDDVKLAGGSPAPVEKKEEKKEAPKQEKKEAPKQEKKKAPKQQQQKKNKKKSNKKKNKSKKKQKGKGKGKKEEAVPIEKLLKAATKEGGKKAQDICGLNETGGVAHFHLSLEKTGDSWELMEAAMAGMNKPVEEGADDRKGGAGHIGKALFGLSDAKCIIYLHVPAAMAEKMSATEWANELCKPVEGKIIDGENTEFVKCEIMGDPAKDRFPIKLKDNAINAGFAVLKARQLVMDDDESDDEFYGGEYLCDHGTY